MKFEKQIEKFIELRILGKSFDEISKEIKTSKNTLLDWNKQFEIRATISEQKSLKINALVKHYELDRENKLKANLEFTQKLNKELASRDLTQIPTSKLLDMLIIQENRFKDSIGDFVTFGVNPYCGMVGENLDGYFGMRLDD